MFLIRGFLLFSVISLITYITSAEQYFTPKLLKLK